MLLHCNCSRSLRVQRYTAVKLICLYGVYDILGLVAIKLLFLIRVVCVGHLVSLLFFLLSPVHYRRFLLAGTNLSCFQGTDKVAAIFIAH